MPKSLSCTALAPTPPADWFFYRNLLKSVSGNRLKVSTSNLLSIIISTNIIFRSKSPLKVLKSSRRRSSKWHIVARQSGENINIFLSSTFFCSQFLLSFFQSRPDLIIFCFHFLLLLLNAAFYLYDFFLSNTIFHSLTVPLSYSPSLPLTVSLSYSLSLLQPLSLTVSLSYSLSLLQSLCLIVSLS